MKKRKTSAIVHEVQSTIILTGTHSTNRHLRFKLFFILKSRYEYMIRITGAKVQLKYRERNSSYPLILQELQNCRDTGCRRWTWLHHRAHCKWNVMTHVLSALNRMYTAPNDHFAVVQIKWLTLRQYLLFPVAGQQRVPRHLLGLFRCR